MNGANIFASIVIGFCGGSLVRVFTGPVIEVPNFTQKQPAPQRLVFMPKEINGETHYVLSRVENGSTPYIVPHNHEIVRQENQRLHEHMQRTETPKRKMSPIEGITERDWNALLEAIRIVESNNNPNAVGDSGNAIGIYQIWEDYHTDACMAGNITGKYLDCYNPVYAENVVVEYMKRYATKRRLGEVTPEKIARIHNGGPNGWRIGATDKYWAKVKPIFERLRR